MIIETLSLGEIEVSQDQIYHFSKGIPGFDEEVDFALVTLTDSSFWVLQSIKNQGLSFLLGDPFVFYPSYEFELPDDEAEELGIESEIVIRCIITLKEQVENSTINLLAPIVLNPNGLAGKQIVIHRTPYHTKHNLFGDNLEVNGKDSD